MILQKSYDELDRYVDMFESPSPTHGYLPVVAAFWVYVGLAGAVAFVAHTVWLSPGQSLYVFIFAAIVLLKPFIPLFRRLLPDSHREDEPAL